jgi:serine/threonine protein kinase
VSRIRLESGSTPFPGLKLVQLRGRGGFAEVWEAVDANGERVAVKFMASRNSSSSVHEMRIIQAIQRLSHRNLLCIKNVLSIPNYIVVAMELADGSLFDLLDVYQTEYQSTLAAPLVVGYLRQAAMALDFLNTRRHNFEGRQVAFQHCDVKPSNLLLTGETVKVADFGLSTPVLSFPATCDKAGTLDFAAPEVNRGILAESSDQYSLAITYYYLRTGTLPFPSRTGRFCREYSYTRPAPDLSKVTRGERRVLERALDLEPSNRWSSCSLLMGNMYDAINRPEPEPSRRSIIAGAIVVTPS